ncbi:MAG: SHOCT domain-containing protein [Hyphomonadaceae bacterium]|nr:SHOCT domain-containing protein [Hyphomonadaceae bacterium]
MWWGGYGMFLGPVFLIIGLAVAISLALLLARSFGDAQGHAAPPLNKTPVDILKERFARGEIDKEEFEDRRRTLGE